MWYMNSYLKRNLLKVNLLSSIWPFTLAWKQYYTLQRKLALSHDFWKPPTLLKIIFYQCGPSSEIQRQLSYMWCPSTVPPFPTLLLDWQQLAAFWEEADWEGLHGKKHAWWLSDNEYESHVMGCGWPRLMYAQCSLPYWHWLLFYSKILNNSFFALMSPLTLVH